MRLGRIVEHDIRSLEYPADRAPTGGRRSVLHHRHGKPFDQGALGSCTGNAIAGLLMSDPYWSHLPHPLSEVDAVKFYSWATHHDSAPGAYPPDDTGSSGLAAAKAAKHFGYVSGYRHAFGLEHALDALVLAPVITGVNWYDSFDQPDAGGHVTISPDAQVRGGHEFEVIGIDLPSATVRAVNSWGDSWGDHGQFTFSWGDWARLLNEQGDVTAVTV